MRYRALNEYLKERFGCKVYKLALDGGMTCPNRDGTLGTRGCIFCSRRGSGDFAVSAELDIAAQLDAARVIVAGKARQAKYIAYFQSFTNTYAPVDKLERLYQAAMLPDDIVALYFRRSIDVAKALEYLETDLDRTGIANNSSVHCGIYQTRV